ncbi:MAG: GGDEF domain-containing protein [Acidobacteriia bacterium]|nr:GGDEF domain-containing protein [Terriglobia bacterium]
MPIHYPRNVPSYDLAKLDSLQWGSGLSLGADLAMPDGKQPELQDRLRTLSQRLEELSAVPAGAGHAEEFVALFQEKRRLETTLHAVPELRPRNQSVEYPATKPSRAGHDSESVLANVNRELRKLDKRDWELWLIVTATGVLVGAGLLAVLLPAAFLKSGSLHFEITVSKELACGLLVLLILANTYLVTRRIEFRQLRQKMISTAMQNELIRLQSFTDPLTEIYNRRSLEELAGRFIGQAKRLGNPLTFLLVDLDHFKKVNTRFGHLTGDFVLTEIAALLKGSIRGTDAAIRYGGDEFLIALSNTNAAGAATVLNRIETSLNEWNQSSSLDDFAVSLSIGMAEWTDGKTLDEVLDLADRNMYEEKSQRSPWSKPGHGALGSTLQPQE